MSRPYLTVLCATLALGAGCGQPDVNQGPNGDKADDCGVDHAIGLDTDFGQRAFTTPVAAVPHPSLTGRWYIAEQRGIVWTMVRADGIVTPRRFVDLRSRVNSEPGEGGLFSIALHPNFDQNGHVFIAYTAASAASPANLQSRVSRFTSEDGGLTLNRDSEEILLSEEQPFENHNGGQIAFGPDGLLYIGLGDGGAAGDPLGNSQDPNEILGKILRIDVDGAFPFTIPSDNPFANGGGRPEIYATGIRNPWRFSFDTANGDLWLADVGQELQEEINVVVKGGNYGWNVREGDNCFESTVCSEDFDNPVATYDHSEGTSITGGFVYRGQNMPELVGSYIFGDFASGRIWSLKRNEGTGEMDRTLLRESGFNISSFAEDNDGELFVIDYISGIISEITPGGIETVCPDAFEMPQPPIDPAAVLTFDELYDTVLSVDCAPCHTSRALGGLRMANADAAFANLVDIPAETSACAGRTRVIASDPDSSLLFGKVSGVNLCGPLMPLGGTLDGPAIEEIRKWIEAGAAR